MPAKPRRRWWLRGVFAFLLLLIGGFVGTRFVFDYTTKRAWDDAVAEADALDPGWRLEAMLADRTEIADAENSGPTILSIGNAVEKAALSGRPNFMEFFEEQAPPPQAQWDAPRLAYIRAELAKVPKSLADARGLKDKAKGRFKFAYAENYWETNPSQVDHCRRTGFLLQYDTYLLAHDGVRSRVALRFSEKSGGS